MASETNPRKRALIEGKAGLEITVNCLPSDRIILEHDDINVLQKIQKQLTSEAYVSIGKKVLVPNKRAHELKTKQYPTKTNYCFYCTKPNNKIARHLITIHKHENDIMQILSLPKLSRERKEIFDRLRKLGNYNHNKNSNSPVVVRRKLDSNFENSIPCPNCKAYFKKNTLRHHYRRSSCGQKKLEPRKFLVQSRRVAKYVHHLASQTLHDKIYPVMHDDDICKIVRFDKFATIYGNRLCIKFKSQHHHDMIRAKLRSLGRLLIAVKKHDAAVTDLASIFQPIFFDSVMKGINDVGGLDEVSGKYKAPSTAFNLGITLKDCSSVLISEYIKTGKPERLKSVKNFLKLLTTELNASVNKTVSENQGESSRQKKVVKPILEDIKKLNNFLISKVKDNLKNISDSGFTRERWNNLGEYLLVYIMIFNRRRPGELERALVSDFSNCSSIDPKIDADVFKRFDAESQKLANEFVRFKIRGKKGRTVPVLLNRLMKSALRILVSLRIQAGVLEKNPYLFASRQKNFCGTIKYMRAYRLLQKFASECGAQRPDLLRATDLRKHVATESMKHNLSNYELDGLQDFMGHADKIHRDVYRQPIVERDVVNVSKLLLSAQGCNVDDIINQRLDIVVGTVPENIGSSSPAADGNQEPVKQISQEVSPPKNIDTYSQILQISEDLDSQPQFIDINELIIDGEFAVPIVDSDGNDLSLVNPQEISQAANIKILHMEPALSKREEIISSGKMPLQNQEYDNSIISNPESVASIDISSCKLSETIASAGDHIHDDTYVPETDESSTDSDSSGQTQDHTICEVGDRRKGRTIKKWTPEESEIVLREFAEEIKARKYPSGAKCRDVLARHKNILQRTPRKLKSYLQSYFRQSGTQKSVKQKLQL